MDSQALESIYLEAVLFILLFVSMYVVSFFISRKNAKQYEIDNPLEIRRQKVILKQKHEKVMDDREAELLKLFSDKIINEKELKILQNNLDHIVT